jgi:hypothetical protein
MFDSVRGMRPDITPAQALAAGLVGVPVVANTLRSFGVGGKTKQEVDALNSSVAWSGVVAGVLIGADALLRSARNVAAVKTEAMAMAAVAPMPVAMDDLDIEDPEASTILDDELPDDEQELAAPPPAAVS